MQTPTYNMISKAFAESGAKQNIKLINPQLTIVRTADDTVLLNEVWFFIKTKIAITREQIEAAMKLIPQDSKLQTAAKTVFDKTKKIEKEIEPVDFIDAYLKDSQNLKSINDQSPLCSWNDKIIDGPVEVPDHAWSSYYTSYEKYDRNYTELGMIWHSIILFRNGIALRIAHAANIQHAILPQTAKILEGVEFKNDLQETMAIQEVVKLDEDTKSIKSIGDLISRISKTPESFIPRADINQMGKYTTELLGADISQFEYDTQLKQ